MFKKFSKFFILFTVVFVLLASTPLSYADVYNRADIDRPVMDRNIMSDFFSIMPPKIQVFLSVLIPERIHMRVFGSLDSIRIGDQD